MSDPVTSADQLTDPTATGNAAPDAGNTAPGPVGVMAPPDQTPAQSAPAAGSQYPPSPDQPGGQAPQGGPTNPNTHGWRAVLQGALQGLESHMKGAAQGLLTGGIPGAVAGAAAPQLAQNAMNYRKQEMASNINFRNAEAASQLADAHMRTVQAQQMPQELQLRRDQMEEGMFNSLVSMGLIPRAVSESTDAGAHAGVQQIQGAQPDGKFPSMIYLHFGNHNFAFDPNDLASNSGVLKQINEYQSIVGGPAFGSTMQLQKYANKTALEQAAMTIFSPVPIKGNVKASNAQIQQYQGYINTVNARPDDDPTKDSTLDKLKAAQKILSDAHKADYNEDIAKAAARGASSQNAKAVSVIDPATNTARYVDALTAKQQGLTPAGEGVKLEAKAANLQDMQTSSQSTRGAINSLQTKIGPKELVQIQAALRSSDEGYIENIKKNLLESGLKPDQNQFVTNILNLQERALSLRSIAGQGQGSDAQRNAVVRLLPGIQDLNNKPLMMSKLDKFDQQIGIYFKNLPKVNVQGVAGGTSQAAPAQASPAAGGADPFAAVGGKSRSQGNQ